MIIKELVAKAKAAAPDLLASVPEHRAATLLREAFKQIIVELQTTEDGVLQVGGLGRFRVMQVEREKDGKTELIKRIIFLSAQLKEKE